MVIREQYTKTKAFIKIQEFHPNYSGLTSFYLLWFLFLIDIPTYIDEILCMTNSAKLAVGT